MNADFQDILNEILFDLRPFGIINENPADLRSSASFYAIS